MLAVNYTTLRENMKSCFDKVEDSCEPMIVTRKNNNMIIMSQDYYDSLMETIYLIQNQNNLKHLEKSIQQHKKLKTHSHKLIEDSE